MGRRIRRGAVAGSVVASALLALLWARGQAEADQWVVSSNDWEGGGVPGTGRLAARRWAVSAERGILVLDVDRYNVGVGSRDPHADLWARAYPAGWTGEHLVASAADPFGPSTGPLGFGAVMADTRTECDRHGGVSTRTRLAGPVWAVMLVLVAPAGAWGAGRASHYAVRFYRRRGAHADGTRGLTAAAASRSSSFMSSCFTVPRSNL